MSDARLRDPRVLVGALGLILALAAFLLFGPLRGGDAPAEEPAPLSAPLAVAPVSEVPAAPEPLPTETAEGETTGTRETFQVFSARDPFQQLVAVAAQGTAAPSAEPGSTPSPGASPSPSPSSAGVKVGGTTIELVDVYDSSGTDRAQVTVNGTGYDIAQGETFAQSVKLLAIDDPCATLLFGDSRFTACEGEQVRK